MQPAATSPSAAAPSLPRIWWVAMRPFSFPASVASVVFGGVLAVTVGGARPDVPILVLAAVTMALLHGASNALNDAYDYRKGLDGPVLPVSGAVVRGYASPRAAMRLASVQLAVGSVLGLFIAWHVGWIVLAIGAVGVAVGVLYSATPAGLKYHAFGDLSVFVDFGILGSLGAWVTQTGRLSWLPVLWAIPISLLVVAILHANNWRDIASDTSKGCVTVASLLGDRGSARYYTLLLLVPFALILGFIAVPRLTGLGTPMPVTFAVTLLAMPLVQRNLGRARRRAAPAQPLDFLALDGATAQLELAFSLLCTAGALLSLLVD